MFKILTHSAEEAGQVLKQGGIVVFPTETVYGIGASAFDHSACRRLYAIKQRPLDNPLIIHVASIDQADAIAVIEKQHYKLIETFFPGPLTLILPKKTPSLFTAGLKTVAVRMPQLNLAREMIAAASVPIAAPSANLSGKPSITRLEDAVMQFEGHVDKILSGPDCMIGIESTVIDLSGENPIYLRPGTISFEALLPFLPNLRLHYPQTMENPVSPGLKYSHYAPECSVLLVEDLTDIEPLHSGQIGFSLKKQSALDVLISNNEEYGKRLYSFFIDCDRRGLKYAYCQYPKRDALEPALLNRLFKASTANRSF